MKIDKNLNRKIHIYYLTSKLNRANAVLEKLRHFVNSEILFKIYLFLDLLKWVIKSSNIFGC